MACLIAKPQTSNKKLQILKTPSGSGEVITEDSSKIPRRILPELHDAMDHKRYTPMCLDLIIWS